MQKNTTRPGSNALDDWAGWLSLLSALEVVALARHGLSDDVPQLDLRDVPSRPRWGAASPMHGLVEGGLVALHEQAGPLDVTGRFELLETESESAALVTDAAIVLPSRTSARLILAERLIPAYRKHDAAVPNAIVAVLPGAAGRPPVLAYALRSTGPGRTVGNEVIDRLGGRALDLVRVEMVMDLIRPERRDPSLSDLLDRPETPSTHNFDRSTR